MQQYPKGQQNFPYGRNEPHKKEHVESGEHRKFMEHCATHTKTIGVRIESAEPKKILMNRESDRYKLPTSHCHVTSLSIGNMGSEGGIGSNSGGVVVSVKAKKSNTSQWDFIGPISCDDFVEKSYSMTLFPMRPLEKLFCVDQLSYHQAASCLDKKGFSEIKNGYRRHDSEHVWIDENSSYGASFAQLQKRQGNLKFPLKQGEELGISHQVYAQLNGKLPNATIDDDEISGNMFELDEIEITADGIEEITRFEIKIEYQSFGIMDNKY